MSPYLLDIQSSEMGEMVLRVVVVANVDARMFAFRFSTSHHAQGSFSPR